jgi:putative DNA primase/helicase
MQVELARLFVFFRRTRKGNLSPVNPPPGLAAALLSSGGEGLPVLTGVLPHPAFDPAQGRVMCESGYDKRTGLLLDFGRLRLPPIPDAPTREEGLAALERVAEVIDEFPFVDPVDRSVALAYGLTLLQRRLIDICPLFLFTASTPGTGKTLLSTVWPRLVLGHDPATQAYPSDDGELGKTLFAALLDGQPALLLDNVVGRFGAKDLCTVSTSTTMRQRVLGLSRTIEVSTAAVVAINGNNAEATKDVAERALPCRLDAGVEHPENRTFRRDLLAWVEQSRPRLLSDLLTFLNAYHTAQDKPKIKPWRFAEWSRAVRAPLIWAGYPDPLQAQSDAKESDPERAALQALLAAWHAEFGAKPMILRDVIGRSIDRAAAGSFELRDAIAEVAGDRSGELSARRFGMYLHAHAGRITAGLRFRRGALSAGLARWMVESASVESGQ